MRPLAVDFREASRPPRWMWPATAVLALAGVGLIAAAVVTWDSVRRLEQELELARRKAGEKQPISPPRPPAYESSARQMLREAKSPWPQWLTALETVKIEGVDVVAIEIEAAEGRGRVEVKFTDMPTLLQFLDELNAGEPRPRWVLDQARLSDARASGVSTATLSISAGGGR